MRLSRQSSLYKKGLVAGHVILRLCACAMFSAGWLAAQSTTAKTAASATKSQDGAASLGFSIESEMLTYRALESNSEAIACDIAAYLNGTTANFKNPPAGWRAACKRDLSGPAW